MGRNSCIQEFAKMVRIIYAFSYNFVNLILLFFCLHFSITIRSDGPDGFFESIVKSIIFYLSLVSFGSGVALSFERYRIRNSGRFNLCMRVAITMFLSFFAVAGVIEACDDDKGYCRNWRLVNVGYNK
ncbi:hypothetical protein Q2E61_10915 [Microbulbifer thermotolerans]|uniref:hypothetical protein n=1 Tax=Microbulbifer thermotolerans TaxID=252514 RepID=UPI002673116B|nr:hypothetical protein [Microbulbifer thermotolerans]MCX2834647.1 hypothetical protein [Microbulbifer thermotolerans]WKT59417.1 hypothetical protein Q2E61_10915 [Microbulbifer thermotolerans]